jgi:cytochrome c-type biogenesis protein CcmH/NrfF
VTNLCYTEFKCPVCGDSFVLSFNTVSDRVARSFKAEFDAHVNTCESHARFVAYMSERYFNDQSN